MNIVICEDDEIYRNYIERAVNEYIVLKTSNAIPILSSGNPNAVLEYISKSSKVTLYFLDIKLNSSISGFDIASKIRENDYKSHIVFITNYDELMPLTYKYKFEALDYIVKTQSDEVVKKIHDCIEYAEKRQKRGYDKCLNIQSKANNFSIPFEKICYIASIKSTHKLTLYYENGMIEFPSLLKEVEKKLDERFIRCHKSIIVNKDKIIRADKHEHMLSLVGGYSCEYAPRYKGVLEKWK